MCVIRIALAGLLAASVCANLPNSQYWKKRNNITLLAKSLISLKIPCYVFTLSNCNNPKNVTANITERPLTFVRLAPSPAQRTGIRLSSRYGVRWQSSFDADPSPAQRTGMGGGIRVHHNVRRKRKSPHLTFVRVRATKKPRRIGAQET